MVAGSENSDGGEQSRTRAPRTPDSGYWATPLGLSSGAPPPDSGLWILGGWVGGWVNGEKTGPWILDCVAHVISILSDQICRD